MTERPQFNTLPTDLAVSSQIYNEVVKAYNELADAYEDVYVTNQMRIEVMGLLDKQTIMTISSVAEVHETKVEEIGYEVYRKAVLAGKSPLANLSKLGKTEV